MDNTLTLDIFFVVMSLSLLTETIKLWLASTLPNVLQGSRLHFHLNGSPNSFIVVSHWPGLLCTFSLYTWTLSVCNTCTVSTASCHGSLVGGGATLTLATFSWLAVASTVLAFGNLSCDAISDALPPWIIIRQLGLHHAMESYALDTGTNANALLKRSVFLVRSASPPKIMHWAFSLSFESAFLFLSQMFVWDMQIADTKRLVNEITGIIQASKTG